MAAAPLMVGLGGTSNSIRVVSVARKFINAQWAMTRDGFGGAGLVEATLTFRDGDGVKTECSHWCSEDVAMERGWLYRDHAGEFRFSFAALYRDHVRQGC